MVAFGWTLPGCEALAGELTSNCMSTAVGSIWLASAVTVSASHAQVAAAGLRCILRAQATATKPTFVARRRVPCCARFNAYGYRLARGDARQSRSGDYPPRAAIIAERFTLVAAVRGIASTNSTVLGAL